MKRLADRSDATVMRMYRTIEDLTDLRALELGVMRLDRRPTDIRALVDHVLRTLGSSERRRVEVECQTPLSVLADAPRIARVVSRLLHLHLAASAPGVTVRIVLERRGEHAVIAMLGAASAMRLGLDASHDSDGQVGIYVARHAIEAHGGSITAYEQPGAGTWLVLALPLPACEIRRRASAFSASVLVIAKDVGHGSALSLLMRDDGFDAAFARSGEEAMRRNA
jgi:signal transduction histidine kinase